MSVLLVAIGGLLGAVSRYGLSVLLQSIWTIAAINLLGSFVLGFLVHAGTGLSHDMRNGIGVGLIGGFTTFSTLTVQTILEADGGRPSIAAAYLLATTLGGLAAALLGYITGRAI